jgi:hypothetical protein
MEDSFLGMAWSQSEYLNKQTSTILIYVFLNGPNYQKQEI